MLSAQLVMMSFGMCSCFTHPWNKWLPTHYITVVKYLRIFNSVKKRFILRIVVVSGCDLWNSEGHLPGRILIQPTIPHYMKHRECVCVPILWSLSSNVDPERQPLLQKFTGKSSGCGGVEEELERGNGVDFSNTFYACVKFSNL